MVEDVRLAVNGAAQVDFYGRLGGVVPGTVEILDQIEQILMRPVLVGTDLKADDDGSRTAAHSAKSEDSHATSV